jgi:RimJ/RimL family protein N-acetyltransferase
MITLTRATILDIPFVMAAERQPGYEMFVGHWTPSQHREVLDDSSSVYLLGAEDDGPIQGFAMLRDLNDTNGNVYLKRIAVMEAGRGFGQAFLAAVTDWVFTETKAHRFWLEVVEDNMRARHVYAKLGFADEGRERETYWRADGTRGSHRLMSILRPEWNARPKR